MLNGHRFLIMQNERIEISDFYLAAFAIAHGVRLVDISRREGSRRCFFILTSSGDLSEIVKRFRLENDPQVGARSFISAIKRLKSGLYDVC